LNGCDAQILARVSLTKTSEKSDCDEGFEQSLVFNYPETVLVGESGALQKKMVWAKPRLVEAPV